MSKTLQIFLFLQARTVRPAKKQEFRWKFWPG